LLDRDFDGKTKYSDWLFVYQQKGRPPPVKKDESALPAAG
jgi:hypothetical protein